MINANEVTPGRSDRCKGVRLRRVASIEIGVGLHSRWWDRDEEQGARAAVEPGCDGKRVAANDPDADTGVLNDEHTAKRVRTSDALCEQKPPQTQYVLDADSNPRRLCRKAQFHYRT